MASDATIMEAPGVTARHKPRTLAIACAAGILACLFLGGSAQPAMLSDAVLQLFSIGVLLVGLQSWMSRPHGGRDRASRFGLLLAIAIVSVPFFYVVPLPSEVWSQLPSHELIHDSLALSVAKADWRPLSLTPTATWSAWAGLVPPFAVFLCALQLQCGQRRALAGTVVAVALISVFLGLGQVVFGSASLLRFYEETNTREAVGFFANRNHFAALLYAALLFSMAWIVHVGRSFVGPVSADGEGSRRILFALAAVTVISVLVAAQVMVRSRAGLALTLLSVIAGFALAVWTQMQARSRSRGGEGIGLGTVLMGGSGLLSLLLVSNFAFGRVVERLAVDPLGEGRFIFMNNTIEAAQKFLPIGTGPGSFVAVYAAIETPEETAANRYVNHAHNDFAELFLETGAVGVALLVLVLVFLGLRIFAVWRRYCEGSAGGDVALQRAAALIVLALLAHSTVDYPLRTSAMAAVFAFCCALLIDPPGGFSGSEDAPAAGRAATGSKRRRGRRGERAAGEPGALPDSAGRERPPVHWPPADVTSTQQARPSSATVRPWQSDVEWPDAWRRRNDRTNGDQD